MGYILAGAATAAVVCAGAVAVFKTKGKGKTDIVGKEGIVLIEISEAEKGVVKLDGKEYNAISQSGEIAKNAKVVVKKLKDDGIVVERVVF